MKTILLIIGIAAAVLGCKSDQKKENTTTAVTQVQDLVELSESQRHHEWVDLKREQGTFKAFVVYPESNTATDAVVVIHENRGLNDWARSFADQLASKGYIVIAPDLLSNTVEGIERTTDFENSDKAREAIYKLDSLQVIKDLDASFDYVKNLDASTAKVSVIGFCWGGSQAFNYTISNPNLENSMVFYGTAPEDKSTFSKIDTPIYGFYGANDNRVNASIPATEKAMKQHNKSYLPVIYQGAGHAYMRQGAAEDASVEEKKAHDDSWKRMLTILEQTH
ncbi:dienelactone hydrolase family protein [Galbibacter sp.]|jgi:carboxymethylenebutenolidase|uniref:dienelactone hydrolase family protein n=1 Tax=Galbibacter sp. TaxID=2918471 RepID=UPI003A933674